MGVDGPAPGSSNPGAVFVPPSRCALCLIVRYDGTDYYGFQKQSGRPTIQGELERCLQGFWGRGQVLGASRTDAGVHAEGQVVVWRGPVRMPLDRISEVVNRRLPPAIKIVHARWVPAEWDPRRAQAKQYSYRVWRDSLPPSLPWHRLVYPYSAPLSWSRLTEAAQLFVGTHDFRAFRTEGSSARTTVRTVLVSRWAAEDGGRVWRYEVIGTGFLYRMVRHMVGSMLAAADPGGSVAPIRQGLTNVCAKVTPLAPAQGLTLDWIQYGQEESTNVSGSCVGIGG